MQTTFTDEQRRNPRIAEIDKILRACVHCGLCTATCPTYQLLGDERDSPRGRIYLIKDMFERGAPASKEVQFHVDRCLSCLSCMTTCPGGVDYMHLVDHARVHIHETGRRTLRDRFMRSLLAAIVPYPNRFRWALKLVPLGQPFRGVFDKIGMPQLGAMLDLAPRQPVGRVARYAGPGTATTQGESRKRVILLAGCAQQVLKPNINDATIRLLARSGVDVEVAAGAGCCGALTQHMGREASAISFAKANVDAWSKVIAKRPVDAIVANASGCGTTLKDYGHLLKHAGGDYPARAEHIASLVRDVSEFLSEADPGPAVRWSSLRVAYHSACSLQHGQQITDAPKSLLKKAGFSVVDVPEAHLCCGSAGTYNVLQPELAQQLRDRKIENIKSVRPDVIAAGNIGCLTQIGLGTDIPVVHTVELLDWAHGGPVPHGLANLANLVKDVPGARRADEFLKA